MLQTIVKIKKDNPDIAVLTETKLRIDERNMVRKVWGQYMDQETVYLDCSTGANRARGVCILVKNGIQQKVLEMTRSGVGRYIIMAIELNSEKYLIAGIYGEPSADDEESSSVFEEVSAKIQQLRIVHQTKHTVICGDMNVTLSDEDSNKGAQRTRKRRTEAALTRLLEQEKVEDLWRLCSDEAGYTYHNAREMGNGIVRHEASRIDLIAVTGHTLRSPTMKLKDPYSIKADHMVLIADLSPGAQDERLFAHPDELLEVPEYVCHMHNAVREFLVIHSDSAEEYYELENGQCEDEHELNGVREETFGSDQGTPITLKYTSTLKLKCLDRSTKMQDERIKRWYNKIQGKSQGKKTKPIEQWINEYDTKGKPGMFLHALLSHVMAKSKEYAAARKRA